MSEEESKANNTDQDAKRWHTSQRIIDSMPAMIDKIKADRDREAWKRRKAILEREESMQHRSGH